MTETTPILPQSSNLFERKCNLVVHLLPAYASDPLEGIRAALNKNLLKYLPALKGILLGYINLEQDIKGSTVMIQSPHIHVHLTVSCIVFAPRLKDLILVNVAKISPDHVGLLVRGVFSGVVEDIRERYTYEADEFTGNEQWVAKNNPKQIITTGSWLWVRVRRISSFNTDLPLFKCRMADPDTGAIGDLEGDPSAIEGLLGAGEDLTEEQMQSLMTADTDVIDDIFADSPEDMKDEDAAVVNDIEEVKSEAEEPAEKPKKKKKKKRRREGETEEERRLRKEKKRRKRALEASSSTVAIEPPLKKVK
eukprot:gnl/Dysnectes_brevis/2057_a2376_2634.p1 GENE.gnl/Dysnectes_brevis/2057_a2376_2634~~gnl/Dysnectes_brevis/2057_a2376_2634.p1  ORF type:complete len:307 (+),score=74.57 gnl/Dysnectes_brevis/2057_a2376_2634:48-968(+)